MVSPNLTFGYPEEWEAFRDRNELFIDLFPQIITTCEMVLMRDFVAPERIELFTVMYGRLCFEDFLEILMCCGNGSGIAASKLLRTLYERAVTLTYINDHPEELDNFIDYHAVAQKKLFYSLRSIFGKDYLSVEDEQKMLADFEAVKEKFMVTDCEKCGTRRLNHTWNKLDFVAMAKATGGLGKMINEAYYVPMRRTHSTIAALLERAELSAGKVSFNPDAQRKCADMTLMTAHHLLLRVLTVQAKRFEIVGLNDAVDARYQDWITIWKNREFSSTETVPI